ncbi:MAG: nuclear transport factor 2 family protein [Pseudomonadota bacterium]
MSDAQLIIDIYKRVLIEENIAYISEAFDEDIVVHDFYSGATTGAKEMIVLAQALMAQIIYDDIQLVRGVQTGDWCAVVVRVLGRGRTSDRPVDVLGTVTVRLQGSQICEAYHHLDIVSMFEQLGLLPEDTTVQCLAGYRLEVAD